MRIEWFVRRINEPVDGASLFVFRMLLGLLLVVSVLRFFAYGWIEQLYLRPRMHFAYWGFEWLQPWPAPWLHIHFAALALAGACFALGLFYRVSAVACLLLFTSVELFDQTTYLNHYYLVSVLLALAVFAPLAQGWSLDARRRPGSEVRRAWLWVMRAQLGLVYFFAGAAKLKPDWLFSAQPLRIWLTANGDMPVVGRFLGMPEVAYAASWAAALFDLGLPFLLSWRRSRPYAFVAALLFHLGTAYLFHLGLFPWVMLAGATLFFEPEWPRRWLGRWLDPKAPLPAATIGSPLGRAVLVAFALHFATQIALPLRHHLYRGNVIWTEEGMRWAWHVMIVEKAGTVVFHVTEPKSQRSWLVYPREYLTRLQEKAMSTQPDLIVVLAHRIADDFAARGIDGVEVRAEAYVSLNGRASRPLVDPTVDLARERDTIAPKGWLMPAPPEPAP